MVSFILVFEVFIMQFSKTLKLFFLGDSIDSWGPWYNVQSANWKNYWNTTFADTLGALQNRKRSFARLGFSTYQDWDRSFFFSLPPVSMHISLSAVLQFKVYNAATQSNKNIRKLSDMKHYHAENRLSYKNIFAGFVPRVDHMELILTEITSTR